MLPAIKTRLPLSRSYTCFRVQALTGNGLKNVYPFITVHILVYSTSNPRLKFAQAFRDRLRVPKLVEPNSPILVLTCLSRTRCVLKTSQINRKWARPMSIPSSERNVSTYAFENHPKKQIGGLLHLKLHHNFSRVNA